MGSVTSKASNVFSAAGKKLGGPGPLGGLLGTAGGMAGTGIQGPQLANIQAGTNAGDVANAQTGVNNSLQSQQALLTALQGQNGLGQQNAIAGQQGNLYNQLNAANGIGTQNSAIQGLQGAAGQYQNIANGTGPNPAQAMLNQATGQNVANQAALMAGQRGAGANVGLMARQAAQQGAATQQQAVGQGATMQAQQQVNALQGLVGANQAIGGLGGQQLAAQQAQQQAMANQANQVAGQQIGGTQTAAQANLENQGQMQNALAGINNANVSSQNNINAANAGIAGTELQGQQKVVGGLMSKVPVVGSLFAADGGEVPNMAVGGVMPAAQVTGPSSSFGQFLTGWGGGASAPQAPMDTDNSALMQSKPTLLEDKKSGPLPEMPGDGAGEMVAGPDAAAAGGAGGIEALAPLALMASKGGLAEQGGHVKAQNSSQRPVKKGDSLSNDKVPAKLSAGEIVLPRSVTMSKDPVKDSADFVKKVLAKRGKMR